MDVEVTYLQNCPEREARKGQFLCLSHKKLYLFNFAVPQEIKTLQALENIDCTKMQGKEIASVKSKHCQCCIICYVSQSGSGSRICSSPWLQFKMLTYPFKPGLYFNGTRVIVVPVLFCKS